MPKTLQQVNQKIVQAGEILPEVILKNGSKVQTGTVATMLYNIELYNQTDLSHDARKAIEQELLQAVPTLIKVGLFNLFAPEEWINGDNAGRKLVGLGAKSFLNSHTDAS